jgi:lysophospholipase L1-like esterase
VRCGFLSQRRERLFRLDSRLEIGDDGGVKKTVRAMAGGLVMTLLMFGVIEGVIRVTYFIRNARVEYVPLPYAIGHEYGPLPPWLDSLLVLAPDKDLLWKNRPNLTRHYVDLFTPIRSDEDRIRIFRRFSPALPADLAGSGSWEISINSEGFRDGESPKSKPPSAFRIVCLGDSWTFGMNVGQQQAYPQRLGAMLRQQFPDVTFDVLNRGVLGYTSYQGKELLRTRVLDLSPDIVVLAYAMNDATVIGRRDTEAALAQNHPAFKDRVASVIRYSETLRLLQYLLAVAKYKPQPIGHYLARAAEDAKRSDDAETLERFTRVGIADYRQNMTDMIRLARGRGAHVILLYNELSENGPYLRVLQELATSEHVPLVDGSAIIGRERQRIEGELERTLNLDPASAGSTEGRMADDGRVEVVFRLYAGRTPVPHRMSIVGVDPALGSLKPNTVAMYDDGTHGDQRAGDAVWSTTARLPRGDKVFYLYTNSGREGQWEGLDVPHVRELTLASDAGRSRVYAPVETFGRVYAQADSRHADAVGYDLIAQAVLDTLKHDDTFRQHLQHGRGSPSPP